MKFMNSFFVSQHIETGGKAVSVTAFKDEQNSGQFISQGKHFCFLSVHLSLHGV